MFKNLKIGKRLFIGFSILLIFLVAMTVIAIFQLRHLAHQTENLYNHPLQVSNALRSANTNIIKIHRHMKDVVLAQNQTQLAQAIDEVNTLEKEVITHLEWAVKQFLGTKSDLENFVTQFKDWKPIRDEVIALINEDKKTEAAEITKNKGARYVKKLEEDMRGFIDFARNKAKEFLEDAQSKETGSYIIIAIIAFLAIVTAILFAYWITKSITGPLNQAVNVAEHLAQNDLSIQVTSNSNRDEAGILLRAMKKMLDQWRTQILEITEGIRVVADSTGEISTTTSQLASGFNESASSISETVISLKQVKQTSELSSEKARYVSENSRNVVQVSKDGEQSVSLTVDSMSSIQEQVSSIAESIVGLSEQTQSIGEIITVVDDIAEQSRLLAVNASIEAVKAGEQGKGFSVVAAEIKNLAQQSKQSTNQVRGILTEIQKATSNSVMVTEKGNKTVDGGVQQARQTGTAIRELARTIEESYQASAQIEATARQQLAGIEQVFAAMESINAAISQSTEGARQLEKSAQTLEELGNRLAEIVKTYKM